MQAARDALRGLRSSQERTKAERTIDRSHCLPLGLLEKGLLKPSLICVASGMRPQPLFSPVSQGTKVVISLIKQLLSNFLEPEPRWQQNAGGTRHGELRHSSCYHRAGQGRGMAAIPGGYPAHITINCVFIGRRTLNMLVLLGAPQSTAVCTLYFEGGKVAGA